MKKIFTSWVTWVVAGAVLLFAIAIVWSRPQESLETFTGSFVTGYEGDFTKLTYEFSYPADAFSLSGEGRTVMLAETETEHAHTVEFFWNGAAGFSSTREFWETQNKCAECREGNDTLKIGSAKDALLFENDAEEWFVAAYEDYFVIAKLAKPSDAAKKVVESLAIMTEPAPNPEEPMTSFKLYFLNQNIKPVNECNEVVAVKRTVPYTQGVGKAALELLLQGPTRADLAEGYTSNIPTGSKLNSLKIVNGEAQADFNTATESGGGSCSMVGRVAQIRQTLLQFPTVKSVKLSIDGRTGDIFQP